MINMAFMPLYMWEMWDVTPVTHEHTDEQWKVVQYSVWAESAIVQVDQKQVEVTELFMRAVSKMMMGGEWRPPNCTNRPSRPLWRKLWRRWGRLVRQMFSEHGIISGAALHSIIDWVVWEHERKIKVNESALVVSAHSRSSENQLKQLMSVGLFEDNEPLSAAWTPSEIPRLPLFPVRPPSLQ